MKTILIIPYRDRQSHLDFFLKHSWSKLKEKNKDMEIIIVEQQKGKKFNRGATINIGYLYYNNIDNYYITQDVDTNPKKNETFDMYNYKPDDNNFLSIYSAPCGLGGIIKFKGSTFKKVNGFPNDFWGWGSEDKALHNRATFLGCTVKRLINCNEERANIRRGLPSYLNILKHAGPPMNHRTFNYAFNIWNNLPEPKKKKL